MEQEGEGDEVFEIDDFTVITEFERFVVAIEALLQEWGVIGPRQRRKYPKGLLKSCPWQSKSATVSFGETNKLSVKYCYPDLPFETITEQPGSENDGHLPSFAVDISNAEIDFTYHSNISTMYGVSEYILFAPADQVDDAIMTEDQKNVVVSAFRVAQNTVDCEVPMFIQFGHIDRQLFFGTSCNKSVVAHFEGSHLRKGQMRHMHLSGLLDLFREHVKCPISLLEADDIRISVQFDYNVKFPSFTPKDSDDSCEAVECYNLPFGSKDEPIEEFKLIVSWPNLKEEVVNENEYHSDLDLLSAFNWSACVEFNYTEGMLDYVLTRIMDLQKSKDALETAFTLLGVQQSQKVFGQLTDGGIQNIRIAGVSNYSITNPGGLALDEVLMPIAKSVVNRCMDKIFDTVEGDDMDDTLRVKQSSGTIPTPGSAKRSSPEPVIMNESSHVPVQRAVDSGNKIYATLRQIKWTPPDSLTWRFAVAFAHASADDVFGPYAFAQIWIEFVQRLRSFYDKTKDLPGMSDVTQPNLSHCLLHQKLEMLQCCISAKRRRHELYDNTKDFGGDEFFDAQSDQSDSESTESDGASKTTSGTASYKTAKASLSQPSGRLHPFGEMRLLKHKDIPIYVPITQDRSPMTEDMVDEYASYLSSLNDGEARVRAQLDVLFSDMQAFKAANPMCCLEDFIRWHSPKDWIEEEGCLSERMQLPNNTWVKCWEEAMPIPVINQARLFNESKIAEEILSLLENATVQQMVEFLRPVLFDAAVVQLTDKGKCIRTLLDEERLVSSVYRANRSGQRDDYIEALKQLKFAERLISQYSSLRSKLQIQNNAKNSIDPPSEDDLYNFIIALIEDSTSKRELVERNICSHGVPIFGAADGPIGNVVRHMLEREDVTGGRLPRPSRRQYVLKWSVPRPTPNSRAVPQRLFASIEEDEFRLCGAFIEDTVYT
ncbi:hypothetical protein Q1695_001919 [Nippostrongylus brasiliensis]|nr:hypothetical protein Q1695_001919 [Nippostrongylus brasiliensis]